MFNDSFFFRIAETHPPHLRQEWRLWRPPSILYDAVPHFRQRRKQSDITGQALLQIDLLIIWTAFEPPLDSPSLSFFRSLSSSSLLLDGVFERGEKRRNISYLAKKEIPARLLSIHWTRMKGNLLKQLRTHSPIYENSPFGYRWLRAASDIAIVYRNKNRFICFGARNTRSLYSSRLRQFRRKPRTHVAVAV